MSEETPLTYAANKDGTISVKDTDGNDVRYTKEADLLAVKGGAEAADKRTREAQETHATELKTANTNMDQSHQQLLQAEAKVTSLEEQVTQDKGSATELTQVKQELETAKAEKGSLETKTLEYRRAIVAATYSISAKIVEEMDTAKLDAFEEALKAVVATKGIGNYALSGGGGNAGEPLSGREQIRSGFDGLHPSDK